MSQQTNEVVARFDLQEWATHYLPESAFGEDLAIARDLASRVEAPFGHMILEASGLPPLELADDLLPLASNLRRALGELRETGRAELYAFSQPYEWILTREGSKINVSSNDEPAQSYPADELEAALAACCQRLVTVLKQLAPTDPEWASKIAVL